MNKNIKGVRRRNYDDTYFSKGQKIDVTKNHPEMKGLLVDLTWNAPMNMDVDASAFSRV